MGEGPDLGALTEKGPKRQKSPQSVYVKIANCLRNSTMSVKRAHVIKHRVPLGPSQEIKFLGHGGDLSSGPQNLTPSPPRFLQPWPEQYLRTTVLRNCSTGPVWYLLPNAYTSHFTIYSFIHSFIQSLFFHSFTYTFEYIGPCSHKHVTSLQHILVIGAYVLRFYIQSLSVAVSLSLCLPPHLPFSLPLPLILSSLPLPSPPPPLPSPPPPPPQPPTPP